MPEFLLDIDARIYYALTSSLTDPDAYKLTLTLDQIFSPAKLVNSLYIKGTTLMMTAEE
jgi:hypothetical protein